MRDDRPLTPDQAIVLARLQAAGPKDGVLTMHMVPGRRGVWCREKLEALRRRGFVDRDRQNIELWRVTAAGLAFELVPTPCPRTIRERAA